MAVTETSEADAIEMRRSLKFMMMEWIEREWEIVEAQSSIPAAYISVCGKTGHDVPSPLSLGT